MMQSVLPLLLLIIIARNVSSSSIIRINNNTLIEDRAAEADEKLSRFRPSSIFRNFLKPRKVNLFSGCPANTQCSFILSCWWTRDSVGTSCGPFFFCCGSQDSRDDHHINQLYYGPVRNDPTCGRSSTSTSRIVGGEDAAFGQFPWLAFIQVGGSRCGGALVAWRHVVTAGHCVAKTQHNPGNIKVTLGDYILNSDLEGIPSETFGVDEVKVHPKFRFTPQADRFDVAVLLLDRPVEYKFNMRPICLPEKGTDFLGSIGYAAGWGALEPGSKLRPKILQYVPVPIINNQMCEGWHRRRGINIVIFDEMVCAGYEYGGRDSCQGDSGGPLMINYFGIWYLVGIVSAGYSCAKQFQPGIYHRVSSTSDWISTNLY
ncbi:Serine proteinase stubble [Araneus ventricosus]|uniref:Serine proteinase stubble n=1 Tax=Araneus ventricosus TaxID=182803 RepID=A0A4Y2AC33_ARAVE|nr:Serine proteinase stubble [Araneus ventricosus]